MRKLSYLLDTFPVIEGSRGELLMRHNAHWIKSIRTWFHFILGLALILCAIGWGIEIFSDALTRRIDTFAAGAFLFLLLGVGLLLTGLVVVGRRSLTPYQRYFGMAVAIASVLSVWLLHRWGT